MRHNLKFASVDRERFFGKAILLHIRLGEREANGFQRSGIPGETQRDQIIVGWRVAIHVIAGAQVERQRGIDGGARLRHYFARRSVIKDVPLCERLGS